MIINSARRCLFRLRICALVLALATLVGPTGQTSAAGDAAAGGRIDLAVDAQARSAVLTIRTPEGHLRWADLLRGLARAKGFDDAALAGLLPEESLNLNHLAARMAIVGVDRGLGEGVDMSLATDRGEVTALRVRLDEVALLESQRRLKQRLRRATFGVWDQLTGAERRSWGLTLPDGWAEQAQDRPVVVFVHGLHSDAERRQSFISDLRQRGYVVGTFAYPNDGPIVDAGRRLARRLRRIKDDHPKARFDLVTWSMGGLVGRVAAEDAEIAPGNLRRLIMVAPPNHGSQLARFAFGLEIIEHLQGVEQEGLAARLFRAVEDGLSEASVDLMPGSSFLRELNSRARNKDVDYSILLGTAAPLTDAQLERLRQRVAEAGEQNRYVRFFGEKVETWLADLDEVVAGKGDGAVAVKRGKLEGVDDIVTMPFNHMTALQGAGERGAEARLRKAIMQRLGEPAAEQR